MNTMGIHNLIKELWRLKRLNISEKNSPMFGFTDTMADLCGKGGEWVRDGGREYTD